MSRKGVGIGARRENDGGQKKEMMVRAPRNRENRVDEPFGWQEAGINRIEHRAFDIWQEDND